MGTRPLCNHLIRSDFENEKRFYGKRTTSKIHVATPSVYMRPPLRRASIHGECFRRQIIDGARRHTGGAYSVKNDREMSARSMSFSLGLKTKYYVFIEFF